MSFWKWRMLPLLLALSTMADATNPTASDSSSCPAGPFKLHTFRTPNVTNEPDRPYFIVLCDLSTTVRLDPLMHPDAPQCHSHMHSVFGSNRFGPTVSLQDSILGENELVSPGGYYYSPSRNTFVIVYLIYADVRLHLPMARNNDAGQHIVPHTWGWFNVLGTHDVAYRLNHNYWECIFKREGAPIAILAMAWPAASTCTDMRSKIPPSSSITLRHSLGALHVLPQQDCRQVLSCTSLHEGLLL